MDFLRSQLESPKIAAAVGFVAGLILGWFVIGWGVWPVEWTDAGPADLQQDWKLEYLRMAVESYALYPDPQRAKQRWDSLGPDADQLLAQLEQDSSILPNTIANFRQAVGGAAAVAGETQPQQPGAGGEQPAPAGEESQGGGLSPRLILVLLCLVIVGLGAAIAAYLFLFRKRGTGELSPAAQAQEITRATEPTDFVSRGEEPPMAQFMTTYMIGDDLFDDSFSIDSPSGEFLGECGVGISESIGVGEPKKVAAFEVWLFDKNDIQTVTKVLMSQHAYQDVALRERLAAKGEPFYAEPGAEMYLETSDLRLVARVVDMVYGSGEAPAPNSYFERLTLELAVWKK